ncbi:flagellar biosynthesis protein FlhA [Desulfofalx alkaliphila]|uniref:flagellar biosynthesis protein FlhA n=1 Tax=Desulfofalx alkaliphila TaxID=105483 RepID=UPI0004E27964
MSLMEQAGENLRKHNDIIIAGLVIGIILLIIIPLGANALDFLLVISLTLGMVILLITMFTTEPLQFSIFPSLLLVTTLYRLALNIASTRLILGEAAAGQVIHAFGTFVVGNSYVVGAVVFVIITIIQFVVITSGAGRVAEVAARFTLDAMPGKQMSIDADLNSGLITEDEARARREKIQREADFFGAMDGASKFVRGDAIAGIIIIVINVIGGFIIGMAQHGMPLNEAVTTYTMLSIGDGLVHQIPALLISTATGILVTRSKSDDSFGKDLSKQFLNYPKVLALAAGILFVLALVPAMPNLLFFALSAGLGYCAYALNKEKEQEILKEQEMLARQTQEDRRQPENVFNYFQVDPLEVEIGYNLISLTDEGQGGDLLQRLAAVRRQCAIEMGVVVRPIRIRDNMQLHHNKYVIKIRGLPVAEGELMPGHYLAMDPLGQDSEVNGIATREPTFNLPAWWVDETERERVELNGLTVVDCGTVLVTHLTEVIKTHAHELLGRQEVKDLLEVVKERSPAVVEELVPDLMTLGEVQKVMQNLLKENIPIKDLVTILEALADGARLNKDPDYLTEHVRQAMARTISQMYAGPDKKLLVITLHPKLEQMVADSIQQTQLGQYPVMDPSQANSLLEKLQRSVEKAAMTGQNPVLLCSPRVRLPLRRLVERYLPNLALISLNEVAAGVDVEAVGTVNAD